MNGANAERIGAPVNPASLSMSDRIATSLLAQAHRTGRLRIDGNEYNHAR